MREFDYYFFDLFNTLIKLEPYEQECSREYNLLGISKEAWDKNSEYNYENRARGRITSPEEIITGLVRNCRPDAGQEIINTVFNVRKERFRRAMVQIDPDILKTIQELHKRNKKITLISNADAFDTLFWKDSPLFPFFDETVFSCDTGLMKPDAAIYDFAVRKTGADKQSSVFIGDGGFNELEGAKNAGITSVLTTQIIKNTWPEGIPAFALHADYVIENFTELLC
ncbi:MAG: HAD-IA family hydrolase [Treponema sp.]|nr:HAD-IA family hydrolase [Treponema sp.]